MEEPDRRRVAGYEVSVTPMSFLEAIKAGKTVVRYGKTIRSARLGDRCHSYRLARLRALDRQLEEHPFYLGAE